MKPNVAASETGDPLLLTPGPLTTSKRVKEVMDGTWKTGDVWHGLKEGMVKMAPYNAAMTPAARAAADEVQKGIIAGTLHPFTGELKDQKGTLRLKAGETASDEMLSKMDWYVDGVQA